MKWISLGNPRPLPAAKPYSPIVWPSGNTVALPETGWSSCARFDEIVATRRSTREFGPLALEPLGYLLNLTCRVHQLGMEALGFPLSFRPALSAGAIHPVHLVLTGPNFPGWWRYDPEHHALSQVPSLIDSVVVRKAMDEVVETSAATLILFVAEPGKTAAKYADPESLIWRDAGVLLGFLAMGSEALGLSFCPLGVTGEPWASQLLSQPGLVGVGAALVGAQVRGR